MVRETRQIDAFPAERSDLLHGRRANHYALRLVPGLALRFAEHRGQRAADNIDELFINRRRRREPEHPARAQGARSEERRSGKSVSVRVDLGGRRLLKKKITQHTQQNTIKYKHEK